MGDPSFAVSRYFLSQISSDASWKAMASISLGSIFTTVFINPRRSQFLRALDGSQEKSDSPLSLPELQSWVAMCKHKILCRGQKTKFAPGGRQGSWRYS